MKTRNVPESWKRQWSKFMYCFFDYLPVKYEANERELKASLMFTVLMYTAFSTAKALQLPLLKHCLPKKA